MPTVASSEAPRRRAPNLAQQVVTALGDRIRQGEMKPGAKLPTESELVRTFGVSRTVVREALSRLQAEGLAETRHGIGTFVLEPPPRLAIRPEHLATLVDVLHLLELRMPVEIEAAGLAAERRGVADLDSLREAHEAFSAVIARGEESSPADFRFHLAVANATGNRYYADLMRHLGNEVIPRTRVDSPRFGEEGPAAYFARVDREHGAILAAIERGDADGARAAMRTHLSNSRDRLRRAREAARTSGREG